MVCEPPGEPYYIGRIMELLHKGNDPAKPVDALRVNWFYRPKDLSRKAQDTRQLFATMHSDIVPLNTLRGKCVVKHRSEIAQMEQYRKIPDCFWWEKFYDRYIQKNYDAIPTSQIINVPDRVKKVLDERWKFVLVEQGRGKELTSASKSCKRCQGYCARYVLGHNTAYSPSAHPPVHPPPPIFLFSICRAYPVHFRRRCRRRCRHRCRRPLALVSSRLLPLLHKSFPDACKPRPCC